MDYEKKYKELQSLAKSYQGNSLKEFLDLVFPELKESEDERIRKWILDGLDFYADAIGAPEDHKKAIAYLEKQKAKERLDRMAPIYNDKESFESALEKAWKYYNESASRTVDSFEDDYIECVFSKGFREGFLYKEKQKEEEGYEAIPVESTLEYKLGFKAGKESKKQKESLYIEKMCKENVNSFTNEDERAIKSMTRLVKAFYDCNFPTPEGFERKDLLAWLEKQKDTSKAMEAVERIDKYIDEHVANAHDMKDSNPDKKYYRGWDDALGKMSGILQDVYSGKKQKEQNLELYYDKELDSAARKFYFSGGADSPIDSTGLVPIVRMAEFGATWMKKKMEEKQKPVEYADDVVKEAEEYTSKVDCGDYGVEVTEAYIAGVLSERNRGTEWSEEDNEVLQQVIADIEDLISAETSPGFLAKYNKHLAWLKSLRSKTNKKIYEVAKHELAIRFMSYLDDNRLEGKMCLSNSECEDIDKAFKEIDWKKIMQYVKKYLFH